MLIYIRHGERISTQKNEMIRKNWKKTKRYRVNPYDEPITIRGQYESYITGKKIGEYITNKNKIKYIYSSPFTRCIETSIQIIRGLNNPNIKIRIENVLAERELSYCQIYPNFINEKLRFEWVTKNNFGMKEIDSELSLNKIKEKFGDYIDDSYVPCCNENIINTFTPAEYLELYNKFIKLIKNDEDTTIIISHGGYCYLTFHNIIIQENMTNNAYYDFFENKNRGTNFIAFYNNNNKLIFGPRVLFNNNDE